MFQFVSNAELVHGIVTREAKFPYSRCMITKKIVVLSDRKESHNHLCLLLIACRPLSFITGEWGAGLCIWHKARRRGTAAPSCAPVKSH